MPPDAAAAALEIPLARWADRQLRALARETGSARISALDGVTIVGERGANGGYRITGTVSAGLGGSHLMPTRDGGWFALTLIRQEDRELLPALFGEADLAIDDWEAIRLAVSRRQCAALVAQGRLLGLRSASADETPASAAIEWLTLGPRRVRPADHIPLVVDLSAIWAGPLAGHLLWLAGARVIKVESRNRADLLRRDDVTTFALINQGKDSALVDLRESQDRDALLRLIRRADVVIESSRPRALRHLGIDADALVRDVPGLVWLTVTGHGASGERAAWTGIGNDCGVAAGLSRAMERAGGGMGYVGDAIADPLTGIAAARAGWRALQGGRACRLGLAMSAITARVLRQERRWDAAGLDARLRSWGRAIGAPFPPVPRRALLAPLRPLGHDTQAWFGC